MKFVQTALAGVLALAITACGNSQGTSSGGGGGSSQRVKPNLNYAYMTSLEAFRNSSIPKGRMYYWDVSENSLHKLDDLVVGRRTDSDGNVVAESVTRTALGDQASSAVNGVGFDITLPKATETELAAKLSSEFNTHIKGNELETHTNIFGIISANYQALGGAGARIDYRWKIREAINNGDHLVFITNIVYTEDHLVERKFNSAEGNEPLKLTIAGNQLFSIDGRRNTSYSCSGDEPRPCFFKVEVLDPYFAQPDNTLDYRTSRYDPAELARAFRKQ